MNHLKYIEDLYRSIYVDNSPSISIETIYVDNCSSDGSVEFLRCNYPQVKIIKNDTPKGFGENNNIGVYASSGEYIAIINPDVIFQEGCLDRLCEFAEVNGNAGIFVPMLLNPDGSVQFSVRGFVTPKILLWRLLTKGNDEKQNEVIDNYLCRNMNHTKTQPVNWAMGAAIFMHRDIYSVLVGFDMDYFLYMEDEDMCLRAWKKGIPVIYYPQSKMIHNHLRASSKIGKLSWVHFKSMFTFFRKHGLSIDDYAKSHNENNKKDGDL